MKQSKSKLFKREFTEETRIWTFQCSLKNYDNEIKCFIKNIVPLISEDVLHLEEFYEEWETSIVYEMNASKEIVESEDGYVYVDERYGCELIKPVLASEYDKLSRSEKMALYYNY